MRRDRFPLPIFLIVSTVFSGWLFDADAFQADKPKRQAAATTELVRPNEIGGVVQSPKGPEEGVWVIAETGDLPTTYRKIVVTGSGGRFLVPDLPKANYKVWVRGYGLVDSKPAQATLGTRLTIAVMPAPDQKTAAQIYPASYWWSLVHVPARSEFAPGPSVEPRLAPGPPAQILSGIHNQVEWLYAIRECQQCHQLGDKATREIEPALGKFNSTAEAWDHRLKIGQRAYLMQNAINQFPRERALPILADWTDRIANGELPPVPPRPQGIERNLVLTEWNWGEGNGDWIHDAIATDKRKPWLNANGNVYGAATGSGTLTILNPMTNEASKVKVPSRDASETMEPYLMSAGVGVASPYFGNQVLWTDRTSPHNVMMDGKGRLWLTSAIRGRANPDFCKEGSGYRYAQNYPLSQSQRQLSLYDSRSKKWQLIDTCFGTQHLQFGFDKDDTIYFSGQEGAVGWVNTRVFEQTHDEQLAQGWCPAHLQTRQNKFDWKMDKTVPGFPYGIIVNPADGSIWYAAVGIPGQIVRVDPGSNPPAICRTEAYDPPFDSDLAADKTAFLPHGIDADRTGVIWISFAGSGHLASFDRRKCTMRNGPMATGKHCPEGWKLYRLPGPLLTGTDLGTADYPYYNWVDQFDTFGLGRDTPIATGTNSDSLHVLDPKTGKWMTLRVPFPLGFFARGVDGRIDDPKGGWKGRGLWSNFSPTVVWHMERGTEETPILVRFQLRPDPLAH